MNDDDDAVEKQSDKSKPDFHLSESANLKNIKWNNEKTPNSKQMLFSTISHGSASASNSSSSCSKPNQYQLSSNSPSFLKTQFSTPKNLLRKCTSQKMGSSNESEFSITNPFENQSTIDSLLQPSLSPSIFDSVTNNTVNESVNQSPGSFWNIDQIAIMNPVDIDLSKLHEQQNFVKLDSAMELKAQRAIDTFFANGVNLTSPWSSSDRPHYLAIISPAVPPSSRKKQFSRFDPTGTPSAFEPHLEAAEEGDESRNPSVATQTTLSIPCDVDLTKLLRNYYRADSVAASKLPAELQSNELLSNSSLRRKLFFQDAKDTDKFEDCFEENAANEKSRAKKNAIEELDVFPMGADFCVDKSRTSFEAAKTPLLKGKQPLPNTPSTCQSPFSSSPVTGGKMFDLGTPYRTGTQDMAKFECFSPGPEYSPIRCVKHNDGAGDQKPNAAFEDCKVDSKYTASNSSDYPRVIDTPVSCAKSPIPNNTP